MEQKKTAGNSRKNSPEKDSTAPSGEESVEIGNGGEIHQIAGGDHPVLTTNQGVPISDNQNSLKSHPRGPTLLEDFILREKITHFDQERIPERIVHARGTALHEAGSRRTTRGNALGHIRRGGCGSV